MTKLDLFFSSKTIYFLLATFIIILIGCLFVIYNRKKKDIHKSIRKEVNKERRKQKEASAKKKSTKRK